MGDGGGGECFMFLTKDIALLAFKIRYACFPDRYSGLYSRDLRTLHAQRVIVPPSMCGLAKRRLCIRKSS